MQDAPAAQRYLDFISAESPIVRALLARGGATGALIAPFVQERRFKAGDVMIAQGTTPEEILILVEGHATATESVTTDGQASPPLVVNQLAQWDVAGEVSTFTGLPAIATLTAKTDVRALGFSAAELGKISAVSSDTGLALLHRFAESLADKIGRTAHEADPPASLPEATGDWTERNSWTDHEADDDLWGITAFHWTRADATRDASWHPGVRTVPSGEVIAHNGETCRYLMLLVRGTAVVQVDMATTRLLAAQHKRPEHVLIGEEGFFLGRPRKGNVTATTDCRLLEIPASLFMDIAQASPHFAEMLLCGVLVALGRKLADTSEMRARYEATIGGNWTIWGADDDTFIRRYGGL